jgi:hypothetical protein
MFWNHRVRIVALAAQYRIPAIHPEREYGDDGGFSATARDLIDKAASRRNKSGTFCNGPTWDPAVTDGLARDREMILFNNAGVSSSSGEVPTTCEEMGANAVAFIDATRILDCGAQWLYGFPR